MYVCSTTAAIFILSLYYCLLLLLPYYTPYTTTTIGLNYKHPQNARSSYLVVLGNVLVQSAHEDHGHHEGQEDHDQDGVDDGEPVDAVRHGVVHRQVHIPARGPFHLLSETVYSMYV